MIDGYFRVREACARKEDCARARLQICPNRVRPNAQRSNARNLSPRERA